MLELLDDSPLRATHYQLWLLSSGGTLLEGLSLLLLGVAIPLVVQTYGLDPSHVGLLGAALVFGAVPGALAGGKASDKFGRKALYLADMAIVALGAVVSALAMGPWTLFAGQLIVGFGFGIDFPVAGAYVAETMPRTARSRMMVATIAFQSLGMLLGVGFGIAVLAALDRSSAWRWFMIVEMGCALAVLLARLGVPESPRWLTSRGRNVEAGRVIARLAPPEQRNHLMALAASAGESVHRVSRIPEAERRGGVAALFHRAYRAQTCLVSIPWLLLDVAMYGVAVFTPVMLGAVGLSGKGSDVLHSDLISAEGSALVDAFLVVGAVLSLWAVPKLGHLRAQMGGFAGMATGMAIVLVAIHLQVAAAVHVALLLAGFILYNIMTNAGPNATTFTLAPELFPTQLRGTASGFASAAAKLGATIGVFALPPLRSAWGVAGVVGSTVTLTLLGLVLTALFAHEVHEGARLEDEHRATSPLPPPAPLGAAEGTQRTPSHA